MNEHLRSLLIAAPDSCHAGLMHELSRAGATIQGLETEASLLTVRAEVPAAEVLAVESWLRKASHGQGKVIGNNPVGGADA